MGHAANRCGCPSPSSPALDEDEVYANARKLLMRAGNERISCFVLATTSFYPMITPDKSDHFFPKVNLYYHDTFTMICAGYREGLRSTKK